MNAASMRNFYFDSERMKYPNTGQYEYCGQLGRALRRNLLPEEALTYYVPPELDFDWGGRHGELQQHLLHKAWVPRQRDASLWHCTYQKSKYLPRWSVPKVVTIHDLNFLHEPRSNWSIARNLRRIKRNLERADHLVAISRFVASNLEEHTDTRNTPIHVIYNGCEIDYDPEFDAPAYRPTRPFCFTIGPTIPKKNFHVLPCLLRGNDFELVIAGIARQPYLDRIYAEARRHGVADRVKVIGMISHEEKFWYYRQCEAFVFPSIAEGFGLPVIEAMHFGKRVFLSNRTSLPEVGGEFAHYFESFDADAMSEVFECGLAEPMSEPRQRAIAAHAAAFNWDTSARQYLDLYRRAVRSGTGAAAA